MVIRVVQCDAGVHDIGYVAPESLMGRVEVRGRGGTVLQPTISRLESDAAFPKDAPILIITDGACDVLRVPRARLPDAGGPAAALRRPRTAFRFRRGLENLFPPMQAKRSGGGGRQRVSAG